MSTQSAKGERGYFDPDGVAWRVGREQALLLGGGRALLLQVAHPLVAAGVAEHSDYQVNPWRRLERTMRTVWAIVYGTRVQADRASARVRTLHERVRGETARAMGPFPQGTPYSAADPELLLWVHATLVDTALLVYGSWVRPLDDLEQSAYYEEMKTLAVLFGTPPEIIPPTLEDFRAYMRERLASDEICATDAARDVARLVLRPPLPLALRPAAEALGLVTVGLLPERLREQYGFGWGRGRAALVAGSRHSARRFVLPLVPDLARAVAVARRAEGRLGIDLVSRLLPSPES
jgi:uncharacterized protein (DUF2236 family)